MMIIVYERRDKMQDEKMVKSIEEIKRKDAYFEN